MTALTVSPEADESVIFGTTVSDMQDNLGVANGKITGTLKYLDSGTLATDWGAGNFMALKFTDIDEDATSVKVGMEPSVSSGLVEILTDPDKNGVFKVTDKSKQKFVVLSTVGEFTNKQIYDLSELVCQTE